MRSAILILLSILLIGSLSCQKNQPTNPNNKENGDNSEQVNMSSLQIEDDFQYRTSNEVDVRLSVFNNANVPVPGVPFDFYTKVSDSKQKHVARCITDRYGFINIKLNVPMEIKDLIVVGFMQEIRLPIVYNQATAMFGGAGGPQAFLPETPFASSQNSGWQKQPTFHRTDNLLNKASLSDAEFAEAAAYVTFDYVTGYSTGLDGGVPTEMTFDEIDPTFLSRITLALPERTAVTTTYPKYLAENNDIDCIITETCDVWLTFVTEGAGYRNALGYVTYNTAAGYPGNAESLNHQIIYPNASGTGGPGLFTGGGLHSGDKIYLGRFDAGTSLGFFLCQDAWNGTEVNNTKQIFYSNPPYNPESDPLNRQHNVLIWDEEAQKLILAFDDQTRNPGNSDNDFNDAVFYVTVNPPEAVDLTDVVETIPVEDPFYIIQSNEGTLAFEDKWPEQGDYDFNDLVVNYSFTEHLNGENKVNQIDATITLRAIGAAYHNGFAIEFPFSSTGVSLDNNGNTSVQLETNDRTIVKVFDDAYDFYPTMGEGGNFVNTQWGNTFCTPEELTFTLYLSTPIAQADMEYTDPYAYNSSVSVTPPYNSFIYVQGDRGHEVHLPDYPPTSSMTTSLFGLNDDTSSPYLQRYYKTTDGYPWAMHIPIEWEYPQEKCQITWGFLDFATWAESNGSSSQSWYDREIANVNLAYIYVYSYIFVY